MKRIILIAMFAMITISLFAETAKFDAMTKIIIEKAMTGKYADTEFKNGNHSLLSKEGEVKYIQLMVMVNSESADAVISDLGGKIRTKAKDIWTVKLPVNSLESLIASDEIAFISAGQKANLHTNEAIKSTKVDKVHAGETGTILKGEGVIVGVVDSGIDTEHPDFKTENGTRLLYYWKAMDLSNTNSPVKYGYGREYLPAEINAGPIPGKDINGHGTHVHGIAAGNGSANPMYIGVAPNADLIHTSVDFDADQSGEDNLISTAIVDGVAYIFDKAEELNKPAVVNLSLGVSFQSNDGSSLMSQSISNLVEAGKLVVAAAGNEGEFEIRSGTETEDGGAYEIMIFPINVCDLTVGVCPDDEDFLAFGSITFADAGIIDSIYIANYQFDGMGFSPTTIYGFSVDEGSFENHPIINEDDETIGYVNTSIIQNNPLNNSDEILLIVHNGSDLDIEVLDDFWSVVIKTKGEGRFDNLSGIPMPPFIGVTGSLGEPLEATNSGTVSIPADGRKVISVGSYVTRNEWINDFGGTTETGSIIGSISTFSSLGPTRDGRVAPVIVAPGEALIAPYSKDSQGEIIDTYYTPNMGTSMASPMVTGIIALMLQVKPDLTFEEIYEIITFTAIEDEYTGEVPNINAGYGKIDAFEAISLLVGASVEETARNSNIKVFPNPANDVISLGDYNPGARYIIFDANGKALKTGTMQAEINVSDIPSGSYFINVTEGMSSFAVPFSITR